jgi:glycerol-3-phosphate O-acyltransferase
VLSRDKQRVLADVVHRVLAHYGSEPLAVEHTIYDTIYEERRRLEGERRRATTRSQSAFYESIYGEAQRASPERQRTLLEQLVHSFAEEVSGHFDPRIYAVATRALPPALNVLLNAASPLRLLSALPSGFSDLDDQLSIEGEVEALKKMASMGTTVLVPTHVSNLDSIIIGYALHRMGLPPYIYGAGLNLFHNKLIGFFMHNLGAYKVDRQKKAGLYKQVLKTYAGCSIEAGYHNLFFPGGTRSRSGRVEDHLKLGLLGMGLDAYIHNLQAAKPKPDVFVVPCTLNYQLVLEAETLIDDHLKDVGKSRYIIEDDEFSQPRRILDFVQKLFSLHSKIHVVISRSLDVFGNEVDLDGFSRDSRGRRVDRTRYVELDGAPAVHGQRDAEYTRELARAVGTSYRRDTVLNSTNVLAFAVFRLLKTKNPELDLYRLLRSGGREASFATTEVYDRLDRLLVELRALATKGIVRLDNIVLSRDTVTVVGDALAHLASYHRRPAVVRRGDRLFHEDRNLLFYYQNRIDSLNLLPAQVRT